MIPQDLSMGVGCALTETSNPHLFVANFIYPGSRADCCLTIEI